MRACAGFGGRVAQQLAQHSVRTVADLQPLAPPALRALCPSLSEQAAATLLGLAHGVDPQLPRVRPPPKALSLQMTLTPVPLPMHPAATGPAAAAAPVPAGGEADRMLTPLLLLADDAGVRMHALLSVMLRDLLGRVWQDRCTSPSSTMRSANNICMHATVIIRALAPWNAVRWYIASPLALSRGDDS